jgi:hypothetical protein
MNHISQIPSLYASNNNNETLASSQKTDLATKASMTVRVLAVKTDLRAGKPSGCYPWC